jgi:hypothetical protein
MQVLELVAVSFLQIITYFDLVPPLSQKLGQLTRYSD